MPLDQKPLKRPVLGYHHCPERLLPFLESDPDCYLVSVRGNCMKPELEDGDLALISAAIDPQAGQIVCLENGDGNGYVKRLIETIPHFLLPQYANPRNEIVARVVVEMNDPKQCLEASADKFQSIRTVVGVIKASERLDKPKRTKKTVRKGAAA